MASGKDLLGRLEKRFPNVKFPSDAVETLEHVHKFFAENVVHAQNDATHQVLKQYSDWWDSQMGTASQRENPKFLAISEDYSVEELEKCIGKMYELGAPLTLGERRTNEFVLFQEIEIRGTRESNMDAKKLMKPDSQFLKVIGTSMSEIYPTLECLHLFVLDGSGFNNKLGVRETSIRLVWAKVFVDKMRACGVMDTLVARLQRSNNQEVKDLERDAKRFHEANAWKSCFKDSVYISPDPIRMVFNDSVSDPPIVKTENRPFKPIYLYELKRNGAGNVEIQLEWSEESQEQFACNEWVHMTSIRSNGGTELTEWHLEEMPARPNMGADNFRGDAPRRQGARVHMRTNFGSPSDRPVRGPRNGVHEEKVNHIERLFRGSHEEFVSKMKLVMGSEAGEFEVKDHEKSVVWTQKHTGTKVDFRETSQKVSFDGKDGALRQLLAMTTQFMEPVPEGYTGGDRMSRAATRIAGSRAAPSKVFERESQSRPGPTSLAALSVSNQRSTASSSVKKTPYKRRVVEECESEAAGEIALNMGDLVTVTEDDSADMDTLDRWVFGTNDNTGESGWFSLGFTRDP